MVRRQRAASRHSKEVTADCSEEQAELQPKSARKVTHNPGDAFALCSQDKQLEGGRERC
ncbi:hypothetical protein MYCTH_2314252 [Thermothelomyces thermophilus ATCC 42464]|uniref:Uncharacterized protein n=1 Tax=Thermothelomyces thermophilus (strain ATCC 42464 / BCRC 31852 / DSM 1799) TaxID=573729 RepID=G2Q598_THET4|nr:uncharacterized protein MYCTH_2314252 [Thermothelomyces thermophilus ATCC 42464]AEO55438.1 hypothetical protein MYCTH_2314252 [Thermothelomyces thermophilus ATCC 42464]